MATKVDVSAKTILFTIGVILLLWLLYQVREVIVLLFISFIFMSAITPVVRVTSRLRIPQVVTILSIYILVLLFLGGVVASLVPAAVQQSSSLINQLPSILEKLVNYDIDIGVITNQLGSVPSNILRFAVGAFSNILSIFTIFVLTFYLVIEREHLHTYLVHFFGNEDAEKKAEAFIDRTEKRVGEWIRGELLLMVVIGVLTYVGLLLLGLPYALPLALLAGLLEVIPNLGPTLAAIPAILIALTISPLTALGVLAWAIIVQQLENNLIVPKIMQKATGVKPLITLLVLFAGFSLGGVVGAILAMPFYLTMTTLIENIQA